jgi:hypothetical protein
VCDYRASTDDTVPPQNDARQDADSITNERIRPDPNWTLTDQRLLNERSAIGIRPVAMIAYVRMFAYQATTLDNDA